MKNSSSATNRKQLSQLIKFKILFAEGNVSEILHSQRILRPVEIIGNIPFTLYCFHYNTIFFYYFHLTKDSVHLDLWAQNFYNFTSGTVEILKGKDDASLKVPSLPIFIPYCTNLATEVYVSYMQHNFLSKLMAI